MLRLSRALRAQHCPYAILGVAQNASTEDIKRAFQERAKITHPDVVKGRDKHFREMVDAYRILRDPRKRAEHDREVAKQRGEPDLSDGWPRGEGQGLSEAARAKLYNYPVGGTGPRARSQHRYSGQGAAGMQGSSPLQEVAPMLFFALLGCLFAYKHYQANDESKLRSELYSARAPAFSSKKKAEEAVPPDSRATEPTAIRPAEEAFQGSQNLLSPTELSDDADKMVWAYYNPFSAVWHRLPDGFEPPASMDLTAWHKKHIESKEWNRLFAEGKLAEIIPRGGLKVRYVPMWDTHEPVLVKDPVTKKTVQFSERLHRSRSQAHAQPCEVRF